MAQITPIADMNPWAFWARARYLDLSPDDAKAIEDGTATLEQQMRAAAIAQGAKMALIGMPPAREPWEKPS